MGRVGATIAFALVAKNVVDDLVLANRNVLRAQGEAKDLMHATAFTQRPVQIQAGWLDETSSSDVIVLCASAPADDTVKTRADLTYKNTALFAELVPELARRSPQAVFVVVSNPVDVLTFQALTLSGFEPSRVVGTGTLIDSARYRSLLSAAERIHPADIRAYILGEHGDSQFPAISLASTGGEQLIDDARHKSIFEETIQSGYDVFRAKGYTSSAIALAVAMVVESIASDLRITLPLSVLIDGYLGVHDVCLSVPVVVGRAGVVRRLNPELSSQEAAAFRRCAEIVRSEIETNCPAQVR
jgi:L-lactate dehydrogenase